MLSLKFKHCACALFFGSLFFLHSLFAKPVSSDFENCSVLSQQQEWFSAFSFCLRAAKEGDPVAQFLVAFAYRNGQGIETDLGKAVLWYQRAADQELPEAQYNLGMLYDEGIGVSQDYGIAFYWFRKAASSGRARAQHNVGHMYLLGQGVAQSNVNAYMWFYIASSTGYLDSKRALEITKNLMSDADVNRATQMAYHCISKKFKNC